MHSKTIKNTVFDYILKCKPPKFSRLRRALPTLINIAYYRYIHVVTHTRLSNLLYYSLSDCRIVEARFYTRKYLLKVEYP